MLTTESSKTKALKFAKSLLHNKLAACVSIKQIFSFYMWNEDIKEAEEFEIKVKSKPEFKDDLINFIQKNSSYDVPQIIYKKYYSEMEYFDWIDKSI